MAFVARLPTWNTDVTVWRSEGLGVYSEHATIRGQPYTPYRSQDNPGTIGEMYLEFPIAYWSDVRDPARDLLLEPDVVTFEFPAGNVITFEVASVLPRWTNFPNQHCIALLVPRRGLAEPPAPDDPAMPPPNATVLTHHVVQGVSGHTNTGQVLGRITNYSQLDDQSISLNFLFGTNDYALLRAPGQFPDDPFELDVMSFIFPTGSSRRVFYWVVDSVPRNYGTPSEYVEAFSLELSASWVSLWFPQQMPDVWLLNVADCTNDVCMDCPALDAVDLEMPLFGGSGEWHSADRPWDCSSGPDLLHHWLAYRADVPTFGEIHVWCRDDALEPLAKYQGSIVAWDFISPIVCTMYENNSGCDMPNTVTIGV